MEISGQASGQAPGGAHAVSIIPVKVPKPVTTDSVAGITPGAYLLSVLVNGVSIEDGDIVVITSKLVSIFEGRTVKLDDVNPSLRSVLIGKLFNKDPRKVELIASEGGVAAVIPLKRIAKNRIMWERFNNLTHHPEHINKLIRNFSAVFMVKNHGILMDDAGIDLSNTPGGSASLLPADPTASARRLREEIFRLTGRTVAVIITDTTSIVGKVGAQDIAVGFSGIDPVTRKNGETDVFGVPKWGGLDLVVDSIAAMAGVLMGQTNEATPICIFRGVRYQPAEEDQGTEALVYPPGMMLRSALLTGMATLGYVFVSALTWPFGARRAGRWGTQL